MNRYWIAAVAMMMSLGACNAPPVEGVPETEPAAAVAVNDMSVPAPEPTVPTPEPQPAEIRDVRWFGVVPGTPRCAPLYETTGFFTPHSLVEATNANGVGFVMTTDRGETVELRAPDGSYSVFVMGEEHCLSLAALVLASRR